jgi:hypothetical protein
VSLRPAGGRIPVVTPLILLMVALLLPAPAGQAAPIAAPLPALVADGCTPDAAELRRWMIEARAADVDDTKFLKSLDARVKGALRFLYTTPVDASTSPTIDVLLFPRYVAYRIGLMEAIRKMEPIDPGADTPWLCRAG